MRTQISENRDWTYGVSACCGDYSWVIDDDLGCYWLRLVTHVGPSEPESKIPIGEDVNVLIELLARHREHMEKEARP